MRIFNTSLGNTSGRYEFLIPQRLGVAPPPPTLRFASRIKTHTLDDYTSEVGFLSLLYEGRKQPISENKPSLLREQKFDSNF